MGANVAPVGETFTLVVTFAAIDSDGSYIDRVKEYPMSDGVTDYTGAGTAATAILADIIAVSRCDVVSWSIRVDHKGDAGDVTAVGNPYKEAFLTLNPDGGGDGITHAIPAPVAAIVSGKNVDETDALLLAYLDNFEPTGSFTLSDGESISAANQIKSSKLRSVSSGKKFG